MRKKLFLKFTFILLLFSFCICVFAKEEKIVLGEHVTDDVNHTFIYPNLDISNDVNPYSVTLSIENGYFNTSNTELNDGVETYFKFMGGTNTSNDYVSDLKTNEKYKLITFNLIDTVDLSNSDIKNKVILSIKNFLRNIVFYNDKGKDAKFTLSFSEVELTFSNEENNLEGIEVVAFKDPNQTKEHYYAKIIKSGIEWNDAYDIAASLRFNGLQGYLLTITSEEEHNFIYNSLGTMQGWMGAAAIENAGNITFNIKNISWDPASDRINAMGTNKEDYWYWVAGPEAGMKVYRDGAYINFNGGEPNNSGSAEWVAEYGFGDNGKWNDYPNYIGAIEGYYVEFGGFDDDVETVKPVSFVSTFKWNDYDFRNVENKIEDKVNNIKYDENTNEEEIKKSVEEAIIESGIENVSSKIINKKINKNILSYDIEISIGEDNAKTTYTMHIEKKIEIENPKTGDNIVTYVLSLFVSVISLFIIKRIRIEFN